MRTLSYLFLFCGLVLLLPTPRMLAGDKLEPGFSLLFNGKNFDGWREKKVTTKDKANQVFKKFGDDVAPDKLAEEIQKVPGSALLEGKTEAYKGRFKIADGLIRYDPKIGGDRYIETVKEFAKDVRIKFDFKPGPACNNDILFRGTKFDIMFTSANNTSKQHQLETKHVQIGEWAAFELIAAGNTIEHKINNETVRTSKTAAKASSFMLRAEFGAIEIKNIRVKE
jgi:hypothetical protein